MANLSKKIRAKSISLHQILYAMDWMPFYIVILLFIMAIVAPWVIPNSKISDNKHDKEY